jgi:Tfp pilus assembly protein PilX
MIDTYLYMRRTPDRLLSRRPQARLGQIAGSSAIARTTLPARRRLASERGDTLLEVLASAVLVALIAVAMFNGFDVTNRASASERSRAQADALAQQAEDQLRGLPVSSLSELEAKPRVEEVTQNGMKYTITSTAQYVTDATATASCNSSATSGSYIRTTSTVTWASLGVRKPVTESSIISPPPGSALIVQVTNAASAGVAGMSVTATGPLPATAATTLSTASNGCAILALLPGEYNVNVSQTGYVDENWFSKSEEDPHSAHSVYLTAESAVKEPYRFDKAGSLEVESTTESGSSEIDTFVAFNSLMGSPAYRQVGTVGTYEKKPKSATTVFPFAGEGKYSVYAGTCEQNNPQTVNPKNAAAPTVSVLPGKSALAKVVQPPINIRVMSGTKAGKATEGVEIENAVGTLEEPAEPSGCGVTRKFVTTKEGSLPHPGMPYSEYTLCVTGGLSGGNNGGTKGLAKERAYRTTFENNTAAGPSEIAKMTNGGIIEEAKKKFAVIYMGSGASTSPGKLETGSSCP